MAHFKHSRETLALAASFSWCLTDMLVRLGEPQDKHVRRHLGYRLKQEGIDTSHWDKSPRRWYTDEMLAKAVADSVSMAGALRLLGVPNTGGQHAHLSRRVRRAGIDTSHFLGQAHYRGRSAPRRSADDILTVREPLSGREDTALLRRAMLAKGVPHVCALCDNDGSWLGEPLVLTIDHLDGNYHDNRLENLRFLCPNCHAQTANWCRKKRFKT
jgi:5-methylcytosine-specific restriction endonuclease McrA